MTKERAAQIAHEYAKGNFNGYSNAELKEAIAIHYPAATAKDIITSIESKGRPPALEVE